ncbi:MAG: AAA family ATPase, partial [Planctomycetes bacterium]|nr:AAA family ATPase [Planctomycetota bacterium]
DQKRKEMVALKTMHRVEPAALYRFKQEFRALADVSHPNLVTLYELISDGQEWFFTMKLLEGVNFLAHLRPETNLRAHQTTEVQPDQPTPFDREPPPAAAPLLSSLAPPQLGRLREALRQLVEGVAALHQAGKLHCDIKPTNVLVTPAGQVVLLDFGLVVEHAPTQWNAGIERPLGGTVPYMAPEQAAGQPVSPASDWYGVGVMLYEALTGWLPFRGKPLQVIQDKLRMEPPAPRTLVPDVPEDLNALCLDLLRRQPEQRPSGPDILRRLGAAPEAYGAPVYYGPASHPGAPFVGRARHLAALNDAFQSTRSRHATVVYVHGQSGVGKTALVEHFLKDLGQRQGAVVLAGRCYEQESVPYKALDSLIDALTGFLGQLPPLEVETVLPRDILPLVRVFPVLRRVDAVAQRPQRTFQTPDEQELRRRAVAALRELLARLGNRRPLVLAIDDLQWGDVDSARLLEDLLRPPDPPVLLLVGSYRREYKATSPCLQVLLDKQPAAETWLDRRDLPVDALAASEARDLARDLLGQDGPTAATRAEAVARESGGNPYFVHELVQAMQGEAAPAEPAHPAEKINLDEVLWRRVARLPEASRRLLEVVTVAGNPLRQTDAFRAAALEEDRSTLVVLRVGRLLRSAGPGEQDLVETYHDRIRETVLAHLPAEAAKVYHGRLATTLEEAGVYDPETLAAHFLGAANQARAGDYYIEAAEKAAQALAFDRAAKLYRLALELRPMEAADVRKYRTQLGHALANAGRGAEAAQVYLAAAEGADSAEALELKRRAAVQYSISGHFDEGLRVMRTVLSAVGLKYPRTPRRALLSLLWGRLRLRFRRLHFRERPEADIPPAELTRLDICWSAVLSLGVIDIIRGADFQARGLLLALQAGDPFRITRALALEAIHTAAGGSHTAKATARLLEAADQLVQRVPHPYAQGIVTLAHGAVEFLQGLYPAARQHLHEAEEIFRDHCTGVAWELDTARTYGLWSLLFLGEYAELSRRGPALLNDAQERGDLFAATNLKTYVLPMVFLAADRPEQARDSVAQGLAQWSQQGFHAQHLLALFSQVDIELYAGKGQAAWDTLEARWPDFSQSLLTRIQSAHIQLLYCRARSAVAAGAMTANPFPFFFAAENDARQLDRENTPRSRAQAQVIRAGLAMLRKDADTARQLLTEAARAFDQEHMALHAAAARRRLGELLGGAEGRALITQADSTMRSQKIRRPNRLTAVLVPGFPDGEQGVSTP